MTLIPYPTGSIRFRFNGVLIIGNMGKAGQGKLGDRYRWVKDGCILRDLYLYYSCFLRGVCVVNEHIRDGTIKRQKGACSVEELLDKSDTATKLLNLTGIMYKTTYIYNLVSAPTFFPSASLPSVAFNGLEL